MARVTGGRTKRQAAKSEILKAKGLEKAGKIGPGAGHPLNPLRIIAEGRSSGFSGYPQKSTYEKALEKHKKDYPDLVGAIEHESSKIVPKYEEGPHKIKASPQKRGDFKKGGRATRKRSTGVATHGFGKEIR